MACSTVDFTFLLYRLSLAFYVLYAWMCEIRSHVSSKLFFTFTAKFPGTFLNSVQAVRQFVSRFGLYSD
jgi:hypothetical protein